MKRRRPASARFPPQHLASLTQVAPIGLFHTDPRGQIVYINHRWAEISGRSAARSLGNRWSRAIHADDRERVLKLWLDCVTAGREYDVDYRLVRPSGEVRFVHVRAVPVRAARARPRGYIGTVEDITDRVVAEREARDAMAAHEESRRRAIDLLQQREEHLLALIENSSDVIALADAAGTVLFVSNAVRHVSGYAPENVIGRDVFEAVHPDDVARLRAAYERCVREPGGRLVTEYRAMHADGEWRHREVVAANRLDNPAVRAVVINYRDATARKQTEAQRAYLASIVESSEDAIIGVTLEGAIVSWNAAAERLYGYSPREVVGESVRLLAPKSRRHECIDILDRLRRGEHMRRLETERVTKDGRRIDVSLIASPILDSNGTMVGASAVARDITERKRADEALRMKTNQLRAVMSSMPVALWVVDSNWNITLSEGRLLDKLGHVPGVLVGQSLRDYPRAEFIDATRRALAGETVTYSIELQGIPLDCWYSPAHAADGSVSGAIGVAIDVSERRRLEEQFRQSQKMEAVGRLAGGIAHDFNNLLTAIVGFSELVLHDLPPENRSRTDVEEILRAGQSAASLTRQLLAFSRKQILAPQVLDLNTLVQGMNGLLRRVIGEDVELVTSLDDPLPRISADRGQIEQAIMNLVVNARDAMPSGGQLRVQTRDVTLDDAFVAAHRGSFVGRHALLSVSDSGVGMSDEVLAHLFEPFFTTKERGKGTGLGLATVYGIVKQSGGYIGVESAEGRGATFSVYFPAVSSAETDVPVASPPATKSGTETILLVEDQREVREVARAALMRNGYAVLDAQHGPEALELLERHRGPIDLLVTDVVMPMMSGRELATTITDLLGPVRVLYTSGYTDHAIVRDGVLEPGIAFLQKPFTPDQLLRQVREVIDRSR